MKCTSRGPRATVFRHASILQVVEKAAVSWTCMFLAMGYRIWRGTSGMYVSMPVRSEQKDIFPEESL